MKRILSACLNQTILFSCKGNVPKEWAVRSVREEYAAYLRQLDERKIPYRIVAFIVTFIIFMVAASGVSNVLAISGPLFTLIFPMSVVMTVLGVCKKLVPNDGAWKGAVYVASIISIYDAFVTARSNGLISIETEALDNLIAMIPLSSYGFDWLIPTIIGFVVGAVIWKVLGKESKPDATLAST